MKKSHRLVKLLENSISDKRLISRILTKNFYSSIRIIFKNPTKKWSKYLNRHFHQRIQLNGKLVH